MSFFKPIADKPFLIAGPCGAETKEQLFETASFLKELNIDLFRAGVWKPRTRPGSFEGRGEEALQWLSDVKKETGLAITTEVAEPVHIELALKYGVDVLWIGARTTVNPFHVQQLADALRGVDIPVMIKNPVNPDVDLWEGAIERFEQAGIRSVAAIHRGFSTYQSSSIYRNQPNWPIPIELKRRRPELPIFCDPSHITGNSDLVEELSQKAIDMGFDGLMIEIHPCPAKALSDAKQQITPGALQEILSRLILRKQDPADGFGSMQLEQLRQQMDSLDAEIIDLLARRMELSESIGEVKKQCNMTAYQPDRWREILETRSARGKKNDLSSEYISALYELIHHESIRRQLDIMQHANKEVKD